MAFSNRSMMVVEGFARTMGLPVDLAPDGSCSFVFARSGTVSFVPVERTGRVLVSLAWTPVRREIGFDRQLLDTAGFDPLLQTFIHAGKAPDDSALLLVDYDEDALSEQALDATLRRLIDLQGAIA